MKKSSGPFSTVVFSCARTSFLPWNVFILRHRQFSSKTWRRNSMWVKAVTFCIGLVLGVVDVKPILVRAQSLPKVVIGYPARSIASIQLFIAQEKGFFREEGLEVQLNQVRADAAIAAVLTAELFAYDSVGTSVRAFQKGAPIKVLAVNLQSPLFWLVTRPELKSFNELKGKVMGTTSFGGVQHLAGLRMLRRPKRISR